MKIECEVCGKHLSGSDKVIVYGELPYWDGYEYHTFFCCKLHASEYMWAIARRYGSFNLNPNYSFWFKTVAELKNEILEYKYLEQELEEQVRSKR